jgi:hypothetical protein
VVLPASLIMVAGLFAACADPDGVVSQWLRRLFPEAGGASARRRRRRIQVGAAGAAIALVAVLAAAFWRAGIPIRHHVEYRGMVGHLSRILEQSGPDDLLLFEARAASDMHVLALPLAYIYGRNVLVFASGTVDTALLGGFVTWALERYRNVYFLGRGLPLLSKDLGIVQVWRDVFWVPEYESPRNAYPIRVKLKEFRYEQCRLLVGEEARLVQRQPVVPLDDVHLVNFHDVERNRRGTWRWTRGWSEARLTNIRADTTAVSISMENGGRPASAPPAIVEVSLAGRSLGRVTVGRGVQPYAFAVPAALAAELATSDEPAALRLTVSTWVPKVYLGGVDGRELGVMVTHIEVASSPAGGTVGVSSAEQDD